MTQNLQKNSSQNVVKGDILIVDDTPANLRLLSQMLHDQGYQVRPVPDGRLALAAAQARPPDLILLDIRMPEMNGYQVCKQLKADNNTMDIPIIFISALDDIQDKMKAFKVGGVDYITKPFHIEEVLARVETHLTLKKLYAQLQSTNLKMTQELALAGEVQKSFFPPRDTQYPRLAAISNYESCSRDFRRFLRCNPSAAGIHWHFDGGCGG